MGDCPEKKQDGGCTEQCRHDIDTDGHLRYIAAGEIDKESAGKHEYGVARRVTDFEFECLKYKLRAVPDTGSRLNSEQVGHGGYQKAEPAEGIVDNLVFFHCNDAESRD